MVMSTIKNLSSHVFVMFNFCYLLLELEHRAKICLFYNKNLIFILFYIFTSQNISYRLFILPYILLKYQNFLIFLIIFLFLHITTTIHSLPLFSKYDKKKNNYIQNEKCKFQCQCKFTQLL